MGWKVTYRKYKINSLETLVLDDSCINNKKITLMFWQRIKKIFHITALITSTFKWKI